MIEDTKRLRALAVEGAALALVRAQIDPRISLAEIQKRMGTVAAEGSGFYDITMDDQPFVRVFITAEDTFMFRMMKP